MKSKTTSAKGAPKKSEREYNPREWNETNSVEVNPESRLKAGISSGIQLPADMIKKLRRIAGKKGDIGYQTLIKIWIAERLQEELGKRAV